MKAACKATRNRSMYSSPMMARGRAVRGRAMEGKAEEYWRISQVDSLGTVSSIP